MLNVNYQVYFKCRVMLTARKAYMCTWLVWTTPAHIAKEPEGKGTSPTIVMKCSNGSTYTVTKWVFLSL